MKRMRQEVCQLRLQSLTLQVEKQDRQLGVAELCQHLKAESAWRGGGLVAVTTTTPSTLVSPAAIAEPTANRSAQIVAP